MAYQPLARKYRPQRFAELIGQDATATALANSIKLNRPIASLIFTGVRGVGKTTSARLYAKALNCEQGPTAEPCGVCEGCLAIAQGNHPDVIEVDGASHNGVDEVRLLQETLEYVPQRAQYKVYIIDEVHMLSQSAFNALLKTLEEPPKHVVFIFATTEIQRVPRTIISRCQVYHLNKFSLAYIVERLQFILDQEKIPYEEAGLKLIAREGKGSMRDALTLLDQVIVRGNGEIGKQSVMDILRLASGTEWITLLEALLRKDPNQVLTLLDGYDGKGLSYIQVIEGLATYARAAFILREAKSQATVSQLLDMESGEMDALGQLAKQAPVFELNRLFRTAVKCRSDLDGGELDRFIVENYCFEWCLDPGLPEGLHQPNNGGREMTPSPPIRAQAPQHHTESSAAPSPAPQSNGEPNKTRNLKSLWKSQFETEKAPESQTASTAAVAPAKPAQAAASVEPSPVAVKPAAQVVAAAPTPPQEPAAHQVKPPVLQPESVKTAPEPVPQVIQANAATPEPVRQAVEASPQAGATKHDVSFPKTWRDLVEQWRIQKPLQARLLEEAYLISYDANLIRVSIRPESMVARKLLQLDVQKKIEVQLEEMFGFIGRFQVEEHTEQTVVTNIKPEDETKKQDNLLDIRRDEKREAREKLINNVKEHPLTKEALSLFNGTIESIEVIDG